jgi:hypothetical protein
LVNDCVCGAVRQRSQTRAKPIQQIEHQPAELERYRTAFRTITEELIRAEPATFASVSADGLAAVGVSWIQGCAIQAMNDPDHFDTEAYLVAVGETLRTTRGRRVAGAAA